MRKDIGFYAVYFEQEGVLEMTKISVAVIEQMRNDTSREALISFLQDRHPDASAEAEVDMVISTLESLKLVT